MSLPAFLAGSRKTKRILMLRNKGQLRQGRSYNVVISTAEQLIAMKAATEEKKKKSVEPAAAALPVPSQNKIVAPASLQTSTPEKPAGPVTPKSRKYAKPLQQSGS